VAKQNEGAIPSQDQHKVVEQSTSDQLRTTTDGNATQDQEVVVEQEGATEWYTALEAVCRRTNQFIRAQVQWKPTSSRIVILEPI